ncbi:MAG: 3-oxoacid CoA-transferase subunit B [Alphaproteobacteria bacterium]|nr:MAG: 3-oxoacid CoA-transferase subunit B [Alphaproteobacteria bacterium]
MSFNRKLSEQDEIILKRAALEVSDGQTVNLGIGLPTLLPVYLPKGVRVMFHSENGFLGMGKPVPGGTPDDNVIDAGGRSCQLVPGASCFDSVLSFTIVRSGRLDLVVLGAFEVSSAGDLANWMIPGKLTPGMGGGMEIAQKAKRVMIVTSHMDKQGRPKIVKKCSLPLTAPGCVDTLVTERAVFRRRDGRLMLSSINPGHTLKSALEGLDFDVPVQDGLEAWAA